MRILLVAPVPPQTGGAGAIPVLLDAELVGLCRRHEVTLITALGDEEGEAEAVARLRSEVDVRVADRRRPPPGWRRRRRQLRLAATWARGRWPWRTVWFAAPEIQLLLDEIAAEREFDVVAVEDSAMSVFRYPSGVPTVFTHHEVLRPRGVDWSPGAPARWGRWALGELDWRRWRRFQRGAWRRFDRVQVFSRRDAEAIAELAPEVAPRVRVNPFGLVLPPPADRSREEPGTVLFVGNFAHPPNRDAAIWLAREIMPAVRERAPGAVLRIVGTAPGPEVRALRGPGVEVVADAPGVEPHLEAAAVVLAPVRTGGGMRMKVLQAMAAGKAVVTTSRGTEGYNGFGEEPPLLVAEDGPGIAAATAELLGDGARRHELGERARSFAERHHSPEAWAERLTAVYEEARAAAAEGGDG
ncbi:MAG TPA: glycosyltransferase family 4 protein [Solirubrobacterales bacterium]|jgi:glycosyltransferase involved in cell wall biosynthesis|nr:glycosyltransferase family 4 protein [Solirubrobacterales bacterium]